MKDKDWINTDEQEDIDTVFRWAFRLFIVSLLSFLSILHPIFLIGLFAAIVMIAAGWA